MIHLLAALDVGSIGGGFFVLAVAALPRIEGSTTQRTGFVVGHCIHPFFCLNQRRISSSQKFHHSPSLSKFRLSVCITPDMGRAFSPHVRGYTHTHIFPNI